MKIAGLSLARSTIILCHLAAVTKAGTKEEEDEYVKSFGSKEIVLSPSTSATVKQALLLLPQHY